MQENNEQGKMSIVLCKRMQRKCVRLLKQTSEFLNLNNVRSFEYFDAWRRRNALRRNEIPLINLRELVAFLLCCRLFHILIVVWSSARVDIFCSRETPKEQYIPITLAVGCENMSIVVEWPLFPGLSTIRYYK